MCIVLQFGNFMTSFSSGLENSSWLKKTRTCMKTSSFCPGCDRATWQLVLHTLVLQIQWRQGGLDEPGGQFATPARLTEVLLHPVKESGVGVTWSCRLVEVNDASAENIHRTRLRGLFNFN